MITIRMESFKHLIPSRCLILNLHFISSFFIMLVSWRYTRDIAPSYFSRYTCNRLNSLMTNLWITPWTSWSSLDILHFLLLLHSTLTPPYGSSIVYGHNLKYNSMQTLVHSDCHQLPKPHMGANALSPLTTQKNTVRLLCHHVSNSNSNCS